MSARVTQSFNLFSYLEHVLIAYWVLELWSSVVITTVIIIKLTLTLLASAGAAKDG